MLLAAVLGRALAAMVMLEQLFWLHIPKCGTPFGNLVARAGCALPTGVQLSGEMNTPSTEETLSQKDSKVRNDTLKHRESHKCAYARLESGHAPVRDVHYDSGARVVTMLRRPCERLVSGFFYGLHTCRTMQVRHNIRHPSDDHRCGADCQNRLTSFYSNFTRNDAIEYAMCVGLCATNMFTGRQCDDDVGSPAQRLAIQLRATQRLRDDIFFVGLVERWNESVGRFGRMTGTPVLKADYIPGHISPTWGRTEDLRQFYCQHAFSNLIGDNILYDAAVERFNKET